MRPTTAERPSSVSAARYGTRQRLRQPANEQVQTMNNRLNISTVENTEKTSIVPTASLEAKPTYEDYQNKSQTKQGYLPTNPLRHLIFKKVTPDPIEVNIRCIFSRVGEIDTLTERFYAEFLLEASWQEKAFKGSQSRTFDPSIHWTPDLELMNGIGQLHDDITYSVQFDNHGVATVTEQHILKGTLWERMELHHFPVDVQELSLCITTPRIDTEMVFIKNLRKPSGVDRRVFTDEQEWYIFEHVDIEITEQMDEHLDDKHYHPVITCSCHVARKYGYFMWNAYFLIFLITSASLTTFPIPLTNIHGRVQIACTLLLTSITFRWLSNKSLPTISYLTAVDIYATGSIFSLCLLNIYHGVIGYLNQYTSGNTTGTTTNASNIVIIDRWALVIFTILFFAYQLGTLIWMYLVPLKKRRIMFAKDRESRFKVPSKSKNEKATFLNVSEKT